VEVEESLPDSLDLRGARGKKGVEVERAEQVVELAAIWRPPLQLLGLLLVAVRLGLLDPEVQVAVGFLGQSDEVSEGSGVAVARARGTGALLALEAATNLGVQHLIDELLQEEVTHADEEV